MQLNLTIGQDENALTETLYEGSLVEEMEAAFLGYAALVGGRYQTHCTRWWNTYGRQEAEDGYESEFRILVNGTSELHTWKIWQTVGS